MPFAVQFPLESHACQMRLQCHRVEGRVKVRAEEVRWASLQDEMACPDCPMTKKTSMKWVWKGGSIYPPCPMGAPAALPRLRLAALLSTLWASSTMLLSPDHCWNGQCTCIRSAPASSAWMPVTSVFASSFGSIRSWARLPSFAFHPKRQKNRSCLPPTWRHAKNSANAVPSNAFWPRLPLFSLAAPSAVWLVCSHQTGRPDLHRLHCCRSCCSTC